MVKKAVFIVGGYMAHGEYARMFSDAGWEIADKIAKANLLQFTGGSDVTPAFYDMGQHPSTSNNVNRDNQEAIIFKIGIEEEIPMAGICRGGQFLNVMNGGKMWQDVDGHANGRGHEVIDFIDNDTFYATSTHHQMMIPHEEGLVLAVAYESLRKETKDLHGKTHELRFAKKDYNTEGDVEVVYYKESNSLCFQPHPEFDGVPMLAARYFKYIEDYLFADRKKIG